MRPLFKLFAVFTVSLIVTACARLPRTSEVVNVSVMGVNYSADYIDFVLMSPSGVNLGTGGTVDPFSKGGSGGSVCCALVPGVGQTIRIDLRIGGFNDTADQYQKYSRNVLVKGTMPSPNYLLQSFLIVRFFPNLVVEAELIPGDDTRGMRNPRVDQLLIGRRVTRRPGE